MYKKYNLVFFFRMISFALLYEIPCLYIPELFPQISLPIFAAAVIVITTWYEHFQIRFLPSAFICFFSLYIILLFIEFITGVLRCTISDRLFLHLGLGSWIIYIGGLLAFCSTIFYIRNKTWRIFEPLMITGIFCLILWTQKNHALTLFSHPMKASQFTAVFLLLQILQMLFYAPQKNVGNKKPIWSFLLFLPFFLIGVFFVINAYNALSVSNNGGLIQPTLFRFDFSPYLSLQSEIKTNNNLVLIVKTREENTNTFLRRIYLSGWNEKKGFYEKNAQGEEPQTKTVPNHPISIAHTDFKLRSTATQEYFIVNFDPSSLVAMDYPTKVIPYHVWNSASFNGAYAVSSETTGFMPFELFDCEPPSGDSKEGMSVEALRFYTSIDDVTKEKVGPLAQELTENIPGYYDKILLLTSFLHDGNYRYSLKPGVAPDGDQLSYFLFTSKKGYCTYFAFSLCLMLRSLDIPARVAAGFFIQPDSGTLDYYPVRANMAHAWVEVFFPHYGWISFDPTTTKLAPGEDLQIATSPQGDDFFQLLNEIISKRDQLIPETEKATENMHSGWWSNFISKLTKSCRFFIYLIPIIICIVVFVIRKLHAHYILYGVAAPRKVILFVSKKIWHHLRRITKKQNQAQTRFELITNISDNDISELFSLEQKARYAPECTQADAERARYLYARIGKKYRFHAHAFFMVLCCMLVLTTNLNAEQQANAFQIDKQQLLSAATEAINAENWENAIQLLNEGIHSFPADPDFHYTLGVLFSEKKLYSAALDELKQALALGYQKTEIYSILSDTASFLNKDEEALFFLKQYLHYMPSDLFAWSNYGWLCYKTNRLDEGIQALHSIIDTYGPDSNIYVGLGNLYTAAFNYTDAKKYYSLAIKLAEGRNQQYLASIYYYNRSILEETFYHFEDAYKDTTQSLSASARASGYLMRGELELRRLDFHSAFTQYLKAFSLDSTPLATLGLADTLIQAGYPDESWQYVQKAMDTTDMSWIANYGTTINQYSADLHKIQKSVFLFRLNAEKRIVVYSIPSVITKIWRCAKYKLQYWYYDALFRLQNKNVAKYYEKSEQEYNTITSQGLYINSFYYLAFDKWQRIAAPYLLQAEAIESGHVPAAKPSYDYENALQTHDVKLFDKTIQTLDQEWERDYLEKALANRIRLIRRQEQELYVPLTDSLFRLNPANFIVYNIDLPVSFTFQNKEYSFQNKRIKKYLLKAGFTEKADASFRIYIDIQDASVSISLRNANKTIYTAYLQSEKHSANLLASMANSFSTAIFRSNPGL